MRTLFPLLVCGIPALAAVPAAAALPPQYQRAAEFRAIAADPGVANAFGGTPIERIAYVRTDLYRVSAGACRLDVAIVDLPTPPDVAGGRRFGVKAGRRICPK